MAASDLYARIWAIEDEIMKIEGDIPFGQEPDAEIIATIHVAVAADLPGLISRVENGLTLEGRELTEKCSSGFDRSAAGLRNEFPDMDRAYVDLIGRVADVYRDILKAYRSA